VPFVARWPGHIKPGSVCDQTICLNGLLATAAEMTGQALPANAGEDSFSFLPALLGQKPGEPMPYMLNRGNDRMGVRQGPWKLVTPPKFWATEEGVQDLLDGKLGKCELYDLDEDLAEKTNLAAQHPEKVEELKALLAKSMAAGRSRPH
jgi:arylsulfatase A-like enzyme